MRRRSSSALLGAALAAAVGTTVVPAHASEAPAFSQPDGCKLPTGSDLPLPGGGARLRVPGDHSTIRQAVEAAKEGDTILIAPGRYHESVVVDKRHLRIRGMDRAKVILDGEIGRADSGERRFRGAGFLVTKKGAGTVIENLTLRHYADAPLFLDNVEGVWIRYVTTYRNRLHNIAVGSRCVEFDHLHASWHGGAGLALQGCDPCDTAVHGSVLARSLFGLVAEDAERGLDVTGNVVARNRGGMLFMPLEPVAPALPGGSPRITIADNRVADNDRTQRVPTEIVADDYEAGGIVMGATEALVKGNHVEGHHRRAGIVVATIVGGPWAGAYNTVRDNTVGCGQTTCYPDPDRRPHPKDTYQADLVQDVSGPGNCWSGNKTAGGDEPATWPPNLQEKEGWACRDGDRLRAQPPGPSSSLVSAAVFREREACPTCPAVWHDETAGSLPTDPAAFERLPDDDRDHAYANDGAIDLWLPKVRAWGSTGAAATGAAGTALP